MWHSYVAPEYRLINEIKSSFDPSFIWANSRWNDKVINENFNNL